MQFMHVFLGAKIYLLMQVLILLHTSAISSSWDRSIVVEYGLWDQLRVDQGKEWVLTLFVQEQLAHLRHNTERAPHLQTTSQLVACLFVDLFKLQ